MAFFPNLSRCMRMFDLVVVVRRGQLECFSASICCATTKNDLLMLGCKFCLFDVLHARDLNQTEYVSCSKYIVQI